MYSVRPGRVSWQPFYSLVPFSASPDIRGRQLKIFWAGATANKGRRKGVLLKPLCICLYDGEAESIVWMACCSVALASLFSLSVEDFIMFRS